MEAGPAESPLTLEELALIADGLAESIGTETATKLAEVLRTDPRFAEPLAELEALARKAGLERRGSGEYLSAAWSLHQALGQLVESEGWRHPDEVLDPDASLGIPYEALVRLARAREADDPGRVLPVRRRLEEALAAEMAEDALVERFVDRLLALPAQRADMLFGRAGREFRDRRAARSARATSKS